MICTDCTVHIKWRNLENKNALYLNYIIYPNDFDISIRSPRYTTNDYIEQLFEDTDVFDESTNRSHRYPNIPNTTNIRSHYPNRTYIRSPRYNNTNIYPNNYTTSIRSPMYINTNTYSNLLLLSIIFASQVSWH